MLKFPENMGAHDSAPAVSFVPYDRDGSAISDDIVSIYMPPGFTISDGASYVEFDMGVIGDDIYAAINRAASQGLDESQFVRLARSIRDTASSLSNKGETTAKFLAARALADAAQSTGIGGSATAEARNIVSAKTGKLLNPNTTVAFQNMAIRAFTFSFTLMPNSEVEADTIKKIEKAFRHHMYPTTENSYILGYPSKYVIRWVGSAEGNYPNLFETYLTGLTVSYNTNAGLPMKDGSPVDTTMELSFQETRVLTRRDIDRLNGGGRENRFSRASASRGLNRTTSTPVSPS